jgi:type IV pilus assembly protein PilW
MKHRATGFGLIELMIAMGIGLLVLAGVLVVFLTQRQAYQSSTSQALLQDSDNALSAIISPLVRGAGFVGCSAIGNGVKTYVTARATPLTFDTSSAIHGFKANTLPTPLIDGSANDTSASDWTPELDASLIAAGGVADGSDVLVLIGSAPGTASVGAVAFGTGTITANNASSSNGFVAPLMIAVSDCGKSSIFQVNSVNTNVLTYSLGPNGTPLYPAGSQLIPIQQTALYVAKGSAHQSGLFEAIMKIPSGGSAADASWSTSEIVPGVMNMQVLYGVGVNGQTTQYVNASAVTNWAAVTTIKLGFLIEGNPTSSNASTNQTTFKLFNTALTVPVDSRLRHIYYMTVNLRNATL